MGWNLENLSTKVVLVAFVAGGVFFGVTLDQDRYTIIPGPVSVFPGRQINGNFKIVPAHWWDASDRGIISKRAGGACIVFRPQDLGYTQMAQKNCTLDKECQIPGEAVKGVYCNKSENKCWAKPDAADYLCKRSKQADETIIFWDADVVYPIQPVPIARPAELKPNADARVVACLQAIDATPDDGCAVPDGPKAIHRWSDPQPVP